MSQVCDQFFSQVTQLQAPVTVFLLNGVKLQGIIESYDAEGFVLRREQMVQLVFRNAISTIMPGSPLPISR